MAVTVLADRGFADGKLLKFLSEERGFGYVVRHRNQSYVTDARGERHKAAKWVGVGGPVRTLRETSIVERRTHSLFRYGLMLYDHIPGRPEERLRPLLEKFARMFDEQRLFRGAIDVI